MHLTDVMDGLFSSQFKSSTTAFNSESVVTHAKKAYRISRIFYNAFRIFYIDAYISFRIISFLNYLYIFLKLLLIIINYILYYIF